jgi:hypothetical protein
LLTAFPIEADSKNKTGNVFQSGEHFFHGGWDSIPIPSFLTQFRLKVDPDEFKTGIELVPMGLNGSNYVLDLLVGISHCKRFSKGFELKLNAPFWIMEWKGHVVVKTWGPQLQLLWSLENLVCLQKTTKRGKINILPGVVRRSDGIVRRPWSNNI